MKSPSEPEQVLVPRLVTRHGQEMVHICLADSRFADGAIVTLEALCGEWQYGILWQTPIVQWRRRKPDALLCVACWQHWMRAEA